MFAGKNWDEWVQQYAQSHRHRWNRACHTLGIPMVAISIPLLATSILVSGLWPLATALFVVGWTFQFIGHAIERKPPEFFRDWRFLFVGLRWWLYKLRGHV